MRIRYEEMGPTPRTEEFRFPVEEKTPFLIGVMGVRAEVTAVTGTTARIKMQGFKDVGFTYPAPWGSSPRRSSGFDYHLVKRATLPPLMNMLSRVE